MGEIDTAAQWEANAPAWIAMSRAGADVYRDLVNTPAFLGALPDVAGLRCLDLGCGEGHNTRLLRDRGAVLTALDVSERFIRAARDASPEMPHVLGDATALPFHDATFDAVTAFMSVMDTADPETTISEAARVLRPGGWFQFSVTHPVNVNPQRRWLADEHGTRTALAVGDYFAEGPVTERWTFSSASEELRARHDLFEITAARRTIAGWLNAVADAGLLVERVVEPTVSVETAQHHPEVADTRIVPFFLIVRARRSRGLLAS
jgi:ubiquinone/menaquinone biosynthesis C-methylase UbiE